MPRKNSSVPKINRSDLRAEQEQLKQFRRDVSILKRKGLLEKSLYDARQVRPTKYLKGLISEYRDVISGNATTAKVSKAKLAEYKKAGFKTRSGRVIVPVQPNESVRVSHGDFRVDATGRGGKISKKILPISSRDLNTWIEDLRKSRIHLNKDEAIAAQFFGYNLHRIFFDLPDRPATEQLADYLEGYRTIDEARAQGDPSKMEEVISNIVIFKTTRDRTKDESWPKPAAEEWRHERMKRSAAKRNRYEADRRKERLGMMTQRQYNEYMDEHAKEEKKRRAEMSEEQKARYKEKARVRAAKSRKAKK